MALSNTVIYYPALWVRMIQVLSMTLPYLAAIHKRSQIVCTRFYTPGKVNRYQACDIDIVFFSRKLYSHTISLE
jgi:hypothetical protein